MSLFSAIILLSVVIISMAAGALLYRWWLSQANVSTAAPGYLITDEIPPANQDKRDLEHQKKDLRQRQFLKTSTPDWGDN